MSRPKKKKRPGKKSNAYLSLSDYVVVDLETTSVTDKPPRILEFGAVRVENDRVVDTFSFLTNPGVLNNAEEHNHITAHMLASASPTIDVLPRFLDFIGDIARRRSQHI